MGFCRVGRDNLIDYVVSQSFNFFPLGSRGDFRSVIEGNIDEALSRLEVCINSVAVWEYGFFDCFHSTQYCTFLYYLSNTIWRNGFGVDVPTRLFLLNKALNGIDLFYEIEMPDVFFIGHSTGIVLSKATYGNYLVIYQGVTVGKNHGVPPVLGERVILYPDSCVVGRSVVGDGAILSQGVRVVNSVIDAGKLVFQNDSGLVFKDRDCVKFDVFFR